MRKFRKVKNKFVNPEHVTHVVEMHACCSGSPCTSVHILGDRYPLVFHGTKAVEVLKELDGPEAEGGPYR